MKRILSLLFLLLLVLTSYGQHIGVKTNLLYDATTTINLGLEVAFSKRVTLDVSGNYNPWTFKDNKQIQHWMVQPELRLWLCERFNGHFFGLHGLGGEFDLNNVKLPFDLYPSLQNYNDRGNFYGGGISYGYQWILGKHWGLEATVGGGYMHINYDQYANVNSNKSLGSYTKNYWGLTKAGITLIYIIH